MIGDYNWHWAQRLPAVDEHQPIQEALTEILHARAELSELDRRRSMLMRRINACNRQIENHAADHYEEKTVANLRLAFGDSSSKSLPR